MPRKKGALSHSQAIREVLKQSPRASAEEVVERLAQQKIQITPSLVYVIKGRLTQMRAHKRVKAARVAQAGQKTGSTDPVALILKIKELAREAGGIESLKAIVCALAD